MTVLSTVKILEHTCRLIGSVPASFRLRCLWAFIVKNELRIATRSFVSRPRNIISKCSCNISCRPVPCYNIRACIVTIFHFRHTNTKSFRPFPNHLSEIISSLCSIFFVKIKNTVASFFVPKKKQGVR